VKPRHARCAEETVGPAIVRAEHVKDRAVAPTAGAPRAWRVRSWLEYAYERGQFDDGEGNALGRTFRAKHRFAAGETYAKLFMVAQSSGKDSTNLDRIASVSTRAPLTERQAEAIRSLAAIESHMGARDKAIVRMVCGENYRLSEAVLSACGKSYRHSVTLRFREALDALIEALETVRRAGQLPASRET
jgi:hypothetical protein